MKTIAFAAILISLNLLAASAPAQILDVRRAVRNKVINKVNNNIDQAIDKQLNKVEEAIVDSVSKKYGQEAEAAKSEGQAAENADGQAEGNVTETQVEPTQVVLQTYSKYDFIPGEKILLYEDFEQDNVGDFPALWNTNVSGEVITTSLFPGKWLQMKEAGYYIPDTKGGFPDNFTVEFDWITLVTEDRPSFDLGFYIVSGNLNNPDEGGAIPGAAGNKINLSEYTSYYSTYGNGDYLLNGTKDFQLEKNTKYHVSIWVQKQRFRLYINENKIFDSPRAMPAGFVYNILRFEMSGESSPLISNFRLASGLPDMRNKLLTEGKLVTYGIGFDVNSDVVKPESYGTLKGIATVLSENPEIRVRITGHTDSDGNDAANLDLSKRRAASVKNELVRGFAIDASRMEADGKGESAPVAPNDNLTNKALNRRVEFVKL